MLLTAAGTKAELRERRGAAAAASSSCKERDGSARRGAAGARMNPESSRPRLRDRRSLRSLQGESEDSQIRRPNYLEPWIVNLLLEYKEPETKEDGQFGHVLKVFNDAKALHHDEECPAAVLRVADGHHYIRVVVAARAIQVTTCSLPQDGFSSIVGQFIILQNYRVCFKEATKVEDCEFYLVLNCFQLTPIKRQEMKQQDCNQEPSILQKIKELWQKSFALQPWHNSASASVSEVLQEIKEDKLNTLKQNVKECLSLLDSTNQLNSEQLAIYPETKWQVERKQEVHQDIFTVPAKLLVISAENEEILRKSCPQKTCQVVPDTSGSTQDDGHSPASFFSVESESPNGSLENPWDIFPAMSLTSSSELSGSPPGLPHTKQVLLARTAEEETPCSNSCTPDFLEFCAHTFHSNSEQVEPSEAASPTLFPPHSKAALKGSVSRDGVPLELNTAHNTSKVLDTDESIPCGQPLKNSHSHVTVSPLSPVISPIVNDPSYGVLSENTQEDEMHCLLRNKMVVTETREETLGTGRKVVAVKRKQMIPDEDRHETFSTSIQTRQKSVEQPSTRAFSISNKLDKVLVWKPPSESVSTPKKSRTERAQVEHQLESNRVQHLQENERMQEAAEGTTGSPEQHIGVQEQKCVRRPPFHVTYEPPTPDVCSQVHSTRISRALLGWARWVFSNVQGQ